MARDSAEHNGRDSEESGSEGSDDSEKRVARRPEGPPHPREGGMGQTLKRSVTEFMEDNGTDWAAALTYYSVLSIFPALIALVSLVGLIADPQQLTSTLTDIVPASAAEALQGPIESLTASPGAAGIALIVGVVGALWTASGYIGGFTRASNVIYEVEEGRSIFVLRPLQMLVTLVQVLLLALVALALVATGPVATKIGSSLGVGSTGVMIWDFAKLPVMGAVVFLAIALLYYASPNAKLRGFGSVLPGAGLAVLVWLLASLGFAFFVANFGSYNQTYGTLAGVIVFLVWLWLTNVAIVLGAEFDAERERSKEIEEGTPGAEREIQLDMRSEPKPKKRSRTA